MKVFAIGLIDVRSSEQIQKHMPAEVPDTLKPYLDAGTQQNLQIIDNFIVEHFVPRNVNSWPW